MRRMMRGGGQCHLVSLVPAWLRERLDKRKTSSRLTSRPPPVSGRNQRSSSHLKAPGAGAGDREKFSRNEETMQIFHLGRKERSSKVRKSRSSELRKMMEITKKDNKKKIDDLAALLKENFK